MAPLSGAERAKRFREKNKTRVREQDALGKRHKRLIMKVNNPVKNEERLRSERLFKQDYRTRKKAIQLLTERHNERDEATPSTSSSSEGFAQCSTHMRSVRKAVKALPKSPRKQKAVVTSLAKKFNLRILPQNRSGRKKQDLSEEEESWLRKFFGRPDITYVTPGKNDQVYMGKVNGQKFLDKNIANGCSATNLESNDTFVGNFDHKLSFRQLYEFIKQNKEYVFNRDIPHATSLCEICENAVYFMKGLNNWLPKSSEQLPTNPHDIDERFSCDSTLEDCMNSKCADCKSRTGNEIIGDRNRNGKSTFSFNEWKKIDDRVQKTPVSIGVKEIMSRFNDHIKTLKRHIHIKRIQNAAFNSLKAN